MSQLISLGESSSIGENVLIKRFFKGVFRSRPPTPRYTQTWDIGQVLTYLKNLGPSDSLDLKTLTLKTVMLMALCSAQRCQTIRHLLNTENIQVTADSLTVTIPDLLKQSRPPASREHRYLNSPGPDLAEPPHPRPPVKMYLLLGFLFCFVPAFFPPFSCVS